MTNRLWNIHLAEESGWYRQQSAILTRKLKTAAPNAWRNARIDAIKQAMRQLGYDDTNKLSITKSWRRA